MIGQWSVEYNHVVHSDFFRLCFAALFQKPGKFFTGEGVTIDGVLRPMGVLLIVRVPQLGQGFSVSGASPDRPPFRSELVWLCDLPCCILGDPK